MDVVQNALVTLGVILGFIAALCLGLSFPGHRFWALWLTAFAIIGAGLGFTCSLHKWLAGLETPQLAPASPPSIKSDMSVKSSTRSEKPKATESPAPRIVTDDDQQAQQYFKDPTAQHIKETIRDAPPLARATIAQQFIGAPVSWDARLVSSVEHSDGRQALSISPGLAEEISLQMVWLPITFPEHNFRLQLRSGAPLHVDGIIKSVDTGGSIWLEDIRLKALPSQ